MNVRNEPWFVRLPDGRVYRAPSTRVLRQFVGEGKIPHESRVRQSPDDEWVALEWTEEFSDLVQWQVHVDDNPTPSPARRPTAAALQLPALPKPTGVASHLDPVRLPTVGVASLVRELLAALDSTLVRRKLAVAGALGLIAALLSIFMRPDFSHLHPENALLRWGGVALVGVLLAATATALLAQMTYIELSRLRTARGRELLAGLLPNFLRLVLAYVLVGGILFLAIASLRWLPGALLAGQVGVSFAPETREILAAAAAVSGLVLEVVLWPVLAAVALLIGPIIVVEQCSVPAALRQWWQLLRQDVGRLLLSEGVALLIGLMVTLGISLPLLLAASGASPVEPLATPVGIALTLLAGLAAAPMIAYLVVANVFIYLNLRYERRPHG